MLSGTERVASNAEQKSLVIKENAKYSFVELGKFNTTASTRRALQTAQPGERELSLHSVLTELRILSKIQGGEQGSQIYTIIERVQSESRGKARAKNESDALSIEISNFSTGSTSRVSTTPGDG